MMAFSNADNSGDGFLDLLHRRVVTLESLIVVLLPGGHFTKRLVDLFEAFIELFLARSRLFLARSRLFLALSDALEDAFNSVEPFVADCHFKFRNIRLSSTAT